MLHSQNAQAIEVTRGVAPGRLTENAVENAERMAVAESLGRQSAPACEQSKH